MKKRGGYTASRPLNLERLPLPLPGDAINETLMDSSDQEYPRRSAPRPSPSLADPDAFDPELIDYPTRPLRWRRRLWLWLRDA